MIVEYKGNCIVSDKDRTEFPKRSFKLEFTEAFIPMMRDIHIKQPLVHIVDGSIFLRDTKDQTLHEGNTYVLGITIDGYLSNAGLDLPNLRQDYDDDLNVYLLSEHQLDKLSRKYRVVVYYMEIKS